MSVRSFDPLKSELKVLASTIGDVEKELDTKKVTTKAKPKKPKAKKKTSKKKE